ncbi:MAG: type II toxin-antitoxin system RelE/ParE family toxin [Elusimicrobia bacterium]|nr:type II toxin-antitoxin system RelE/ParE family toxin [Candidatus Obscuribacterium magneticum]
MLKVLQTYITPSGRDIFNEWFSSLRDKKTRNIIQNRLDRLALGNPGDHKYVGDGVWELRIYYGPGFRVYYGEDGDFIVILLCGGDKSTQSGDIHFAKSYWEEYLNQP